MSKAMHTPAVLSQLHAIRHSVGWTWSQHVKMVRLIGEGAFDLLDRLCPSHLYLREGGMLHTVFLADDGAIVADVYVCCEDEDYLLLYEEVPQSNFLEYLQEAMVQSAGVDLVDLSASHKILSLNGPYAWEALARLAGGEAVGLPYMTFYRVGHWMVLRAGKTGEFGYDIILPEAEVAALKIQIATMAPELDMVECSLPALDQCSLENWFFNIRAEGKYAASAVENQLQWRLEADKEFIGKEGLNQDELSQHTRRLLCVISEHALDEGMPVRFGNNEIGTVVNAGFSAARDQWVGLALVDVAYSHAGIREFTCGEDDPVSVQTVSPPVLNNRSIFINPQIHSYSTRDEFTFPSLIKDFQ